MKRQILALAALAALGIALEALDLFDWARALDWARANAGGWRVPAAIVLAQLALYTFWQPGSILFWAAALLYPPPLATLILTAGGTAGPSDLLRLEVLGPLFAIALLLLLGRLAYRR